jgi:hypothetical protein
MNVVDNLQKITSDENIKSKIDKGVNDYYIQKNFLNWKGLNRTGKMIMNCSFLKVIVIKKIKLKLLVHLFLNLIR